MSSKTLLTNAPMPIFPHMVRTSSSKELYSLQDRAVIEKTRELSRFVLNNPSLETKRLVKTLFFHLGVIVNRYHLNPLDFNYLMEAVPEARSAFSTRHSPDIKDRLSKLEIFVEKLKHFDQVTDFDAHFAQYVSDLESITSAIGYRAIGSSVSGKTTSTASENMKRLLKDVEDHYTVEHIGAHQFPHRRDDDASRDCIKLGIEIPSSKQDAVEGGLPGPQKGCSSRKFTLTSYVSRALSHNIPMRAHVSGTAPLTLASMEFIMNRGAKNRIFDDASLMKLSGLLCATYEMGDFHSYAETAAGVAHFYQAYVKGMHFTDRSDGILENVPPKAFYAMSFGYLNSIVSDRALDEFTKRTTQILDFYVE